VLKNKVIVITGGAGLLGKEFVRSVLAEGAMAVIADINFDLAVELKKTLSDQYPPEKIDICALDITSKTSINEVIEMLASKYQRIDAVVNNAYPRNKNYGKHFFDVEYGDFCENVGLNLGGYFLVAQQFAKYFDTQGFGNIINISSIYGVVAPRFEIYEGTPMTMPVEYAAIKSGINLLTQYMAKYFKGKNIRVNSISLGGISDHQPEPFLTAYKNKCLNKGMLLPEDIGGSLVFLLSEQSQFVNGHNLIVDDGFTL
jgi:NAD(P)-dependent dehydrogenase (short-subunit alcohol dehydrogenase family)